MPDWSDLQKRARADVDLAIEAWVKVLSEELGSRIKYAYAKGSALKKWESPIDYVPTLSDIDIHIMLDDDDLLFSGTSESFDEAMHISKRYEAEFIRLQPEHLHIPRSQIMTINKLTAVVNYVPPRAQDIHVLIGKIPEPEFLTDDEIREIDKQNLMDYHKFIQALPRRIFDRTGLDYWTIVREMTWRVSPCPVRLLTQITDGPLDVWSWNRTKITNELHSHGYNEIEKYYRDFYVNGWNLFLSTFTSSEAYRNCISAGYYTLAKCREEVQNIDESAHAR